MKRIQSIFCVATMISGILSVASCSSEDEAAIAGKKVPLEIQVSGVQTTRSIIEGTTLPEECQYGIFAMQGSGTTVISGGMNACVNYAKGISTFSENVYLPDNMDVPVYAYYPYNANYSNTDYLIGADVTAQTDYLYGYSADNENRLTHVNTEQPKANIYFKHALARVTMRIKKAADNENTYKFPYINLLNVDKNAYINVLEGGAILDPSGTANLTAEPYDYALVNSNNEIVADFLVIPGNTEGKKIMLNMSDDISSFENGLSAAVPVTNWQAGQQYTYTVTIKKGNLEVSQAEITQWKNNEQGGIEVGDDNYGLAVGGTVAEAIDLGLSVKWASWNIGTDTPEGYGGLYFWGDPTGKVAIYNENFPSNDNITGTEYDIARKQWRENWRLPTSEEFEELLSSCSWVLTEQEGVAGYLVTAKNSNSIFLPFAGCAEKESVSYTKRGEAGYYWTGSLVSENCSINLTLSSDSHYIIDDGYPYKAYSVRPVTE